MPAPHAVAGTSGFWADAQAERMTVASRVALKKILAVEPEAGYMIVGLGGVRKLRVAGRSKGESGGYRVVTAHVGSEARVYLLAVPNKGDRENFANAEVREFAKLTRSMKTY